MEAIVGWSKNIVGDISFPNSAERSDVSSVAAIESKPADMSGIFESTYVPMDRLTTDHTIMLLSPSSLCGVFIVVLP